MGYKVAVVGATGNVGHEMLNILHERNFPVDEVYAVASHRSAGREVSFGDTDLKVIDLDKFDFTGIDIVLSSPGAKVSAAFAPRAAKAGAVVIDNTSQFRMDPDVPLVVPEVNPEAIAEHTKRVVVSTYQSVSGAGKDAMDELFNQTRQMYVNEYPKPEQFPKQIAFNVIPQIDVFMDDKMTKEEWKMVVETKKIIDPKIKVCANCVRVPVFVGHAEMINVEFEKDISAKDARKAWREFEGITHIDLDNEAEYVTPKEITGEDDVFVSRLREDPTVENGLNFWCVADNLRKGAALNAVQIAELLTQKQ